MRILPDLTGFWPNILHIGHFLFLVSHFEFCRPFWILPGFWIMFGKWLMNSNLTLRIQFSLLFCLRRTVSEIFPFKFYNAISVHRISPGSRQAGDNRGFYCTVMEAPRYGVLCGGFIPRGPKFHSFLASDARFSRYCSF